MHSPLADRSALLCLDGALPGRLRYSFPAMTEASSQAVESDPLRPHPPLTRYYADEAEHRRRMGAWFDAAAPDYNWINQVLSFGSGNYYRRDALRRAGLAAGMRLLDTGCGTGIVAVQGQQIVGPSGEVVGLDPST